MSYRGRGRGRGNYNNFQGQNSNNHNTNNTNGFQGHNSNFNSNNPQNTQANVNQFVANNSVPIEILGWNGASMDDCVKFISRKCRIVIQNASVDPGTGVLKGFVRSMKDADDLCNWSGVKFAGQSLKITKPATAIANVPGGNKAIETITEFLKSRYQPQVKLLNLTAVHQDQALASQGFFNAISTASKFFPALMKVANNLKIDVESIDLSNNNLTDLTSISTLSTTFPTLKNLSLSNNNFTRLKTFETWRRKLNFLRELIISGNPLLNQVNPEEIKIELMKSFPRLVVLNGEVLRNEAQMKEFMSFPYPRPQQMFFQDEEIRNLSTNFVANFYNLWDTNRLGLVQLYQPESQFSLSVDTSHSHTADETQKVDFGYYLPLSRNLSRISGLKQRMSRVFTGDQIPKAFAQLPNTKHDLINNPQLFAMEAYRFPQLNGVLINLHGSFQETAQPENMDAVNSQGPGPRPKFHRPKKILLSDKSFDRSFIVIPANGSMIVASDSLVIRSPTGGDAWVGSTESPATAAAGVQTVPVVPGVPGAPQPTTAVSPSPVPGPTTADLPPDIKGMLNQVQQEILVKVILETNLNLQYGLMLCQQSNWDYQQAMVNFKNSAATLPRDAFT